MSKKITVVYPDTAAKQFEGQTFRSYKAVAKELEIGCEVTVEVREDEFLMGYGEVEKIAEPTKTHYLSFSYPRRLAHEY